MTSIFAIAVKMLAVVCVVVVATMIAERTRPAFAALIATLPLSVGAAYVLMALEHDAAFVGAAALKSVAGASATVVFIATYAQATLRMRPLPALAAAFIIWAPAAWFVHSTAWTIGSAVLFSIAILSIAYVLTFPLRGLRSTRPARRNWFDAPVRAISVAGFVGVLTAVSSQLGPSGTGTLANFPIIMSSVGLILHTRLGPEGAAGMLANSVAGMAGGSLGLLAVHLAIPSHGAAASLLLGLAICVAWNYMLYAAGRRASLKTGA